MADLPFSTQVMLVFMDNDERKHYESPERTEEERKQIYSELENLWNAIPAATEAELETFMGERDWWETQHNPDARNLRRVQWKKDRKANARAELAKNKSNAIEPKSRKPVDLYDLAKQLELAEKENPPTPEELAERSKHIMDMASSLGLVEVKGSNFKSFFESLKKDQEQIQKTLGDMVKPPPLPRFDSHSPPVADWARAEAKRRQAETDATAHAIERAMDRALQRAEDRAESKRQMDAWARRRGFTPINELNQPQPKDIVSTTDKVRRILEALFGVIAAVAGTQISSMFWSLALLAFGWAMLTALIWELNFLSSQKRRYQSLFNVCLTFVLGLVLFAVWRASRPLPGPLPLTRDEFQQEMEKLKPTQSPIAASSPTQPPSKSKRQTRR